jgi:membrane-bound lytic murein transglycosylase C
MNRRRFLLGASLAPLAVRAQDFDSYQHRQREGVRDQRQAFADYEARLRQAFEAYKRAHREALADHRRRVARIWTHPELTDAHKWVEYGEDGRAQRVVDFGANEIRLKLADRPGPSGEARAEEQLADLLGEDFATAYRRDPVAGRIEQALAGMPEAVARGRPGRQAVLAEVVGSPMPDPERARAKARALLEGARQGRERLADGGWASVISVPLDPDRPMAKARDYLPLVREQAGRQEVGESLVLAVMHTESSFNPMARSHVPAFGLMQIVPESAGKDATRMLMGTPRLLAPSYLYEPANNVEIGAAYLHLLYHRYLAAVESPESRLYCAIAGYNTGPGNVARTFTGGTDMAAAARRINRRSGQAVYRTLVRKLPYRETRDYVERVTRRMGTYSDL